MAEVAIQRGVTQVQASNVNVTVTTATKGIARITASCFSKSGRTAGSSSTNNVDRDLCQTARLNTSTNVLLKPNSSAEAFDHDVHWEVWDFSGAASTPNAAEVRSHSESLMNVGTSQLDILIGSALSVTAADCIAFICGNGPGGNSQNWSDCCYTIEIVTVSTNVYARLKRVTSDARNGFTIAAIEFTGANWVVQNNISHTFTAAGSDETETITDVSDWTKAFIFGSHRSPTGNDGNDEVSITIRPGSSTTTVRFRMRSGASSPGSVVAIAHVVKNNALKVEHIDSITGSGSDLPAGSSSPQTENVTITAVKATAQTALIAFTDCGETAAEYPRPHWAYRLTSTTNVEFWRGRHGTAGDFALQVIQFEHDQTVSASGDIASAEAIGSHTVLRGAVTVTPTAIDTAEAFGTHTILRGAVSVLPTAIPSDEAFGSATVLRGAVILLPTAIASGEALGSATVLRGTVTLLPSGITSLEAFGSLTIVPGLVTVLPSAIASAEAFGSATITNGATNLFPTGIASEEALGTLTVLRGAVTITPTGIASGEAHGQPLIVRYLLPGSISSLESFGSILIRVGPALILPSGIGSDEAFGLPLILSSMQLIQPTGIDGAEAFGDLWIFRHSDPAFKTLLANNRPFLYTASERAYNLLPHRIFNYEGL